ncbi:hypothetical protein GOODEAATRI_000730 [Goodea atripinnis]|uniref:Uncharacterized protein n=1 Tax=Goodea atripinnis TaxID=208336 RepID=A0ABV0N6S6_9TELE
MAADFSQIRPCFYSCFKGLECMFLGAILGTMDCGASSDGMGSSGSILAVCACVCVCDPSQTERAPHSSRVAAVLAPCLVALAIVVMLGLALAAAKLRERRQTEGGFSPRRLEAPGGRNPPAELGNTSISTLAARVERLV